MDSEVEFCMLEQVEKEKSRITATVLRSATFALLIIVSASLQAQTAGASDPSISDTMTNLLQGNFGNDLLPTAANKCDTQTNPQCCGGATNICSTNGMATVTCAAGVCNGACAAGRGDCNNNKLTDGCETSVTTADHCGACATVCPGIGQSTGDATCSTGQCGFTCRGENYDVNNNAADGCERADTVPPGHTQSAASSLGQKDNSDTNAAFSQAIISDGRVHSNPVINGFNSSTGAAPDFWAVNAAGGTFGINDLTATFNTTGGSPTQCYSLTVITNVRTQTCATTGSGSCTISFGSGAYNNGTTVVFKIEKTCSSATREAVSYNVQYHL